MTFLVSERGDEMRLVELKKVIKSLTTLKTKKYWKWKGKDKGGRHKAREEEGDPLVE